MFTRRRFVSTAAALGCALTLALVGTSPGAAMTVNATPDRERDYVVAVLQVGEFDLEADLNGNGVIDPEEDFGPGTWASVFCSGTVVEPTVVLTAGHCNDYAVDNVLSVPDAWVAVTNRDVLPPRALGDWFAYGELGGDVADVVDKGVELNPLYNNGGYRDDVAALRIESGLAVDATLPLIPEPGLLDRLGLRALRGEHVTVLGYGTEAKVAPASAGGSYATTNMRRRADVTIQTIDPARIHERQTAAIGACYGDSGGPTLLQKGSLTSVIGVTSTGDGPCWSTNVASRVDRESVKRFLDGLPK